MASIINASTSGAGGLISTADASGQLDLQTAGITRVSLTPNGGVSFGSSGTAYGTSGQVLQSNGDAAPTWTTNLRYTVDLFADSGSWTVPDGVTTAIVTVVGGGGGCSGTSGIIGGQGGFASAYLTGLTPGNSITITIGAGGSSGSSSTAGGTTSFGSFLSATGGTAGSATNGTRGTGTVSSGTNLGTGSVSNGSSATESSFAVTQYGFAITRIALSGRNAAVSWSPTLGIHPGAAGTGSGTSSNRSGGVGGLVIIEY